MDSINSIEKNPARRYRFFDKSIFWESFKQQKIPGILITTIYLIEAVLVFANVLVEGGKPAYYIGSYYANPGSLHPILSLAFCIAAPVLVLVAFNFLTKRNASDLWHSLPHRRETIFTSVFLSVAAWLVVIIFGTSIVSMTMGLFISENIPTYLLAWLSYTLTNFIQSLLMAACFTLAATLTGTVGNNIIIGLFIAFGPSLFFSSIYSAVIDSIPVYSYQNSSSFLSGELNILAISGLSNMFEDIFKEYFIIGCDIKIVNAPLVYSLILAIIYAVIACILFKKRKSETADQSSLNRKLHAVFRVGLCMVFCIIILTALFKENTGGFIEFNYFYVVCYAVAFVFYFAYELITKRKFNSLIKALPGLGVVVLLNVAIYGFMVGVRSYELNFKPSEDKIDSVSVMFGNQTHAEYDAFFITHYSDYSYVYANASNKVFLEDEEVKKIVAAALDENIEKAKKNRYDYTSFFLNQNGSVNNVNEKYTKVDVNIDTGIITKTRSIYIKNADLYKIRDIYFGNNKYQKAVLTLPEKIFQCNIVPLSLYTIKPDDMRNLYKVYREEIANADFNVFKTLTSSARILSMNIREDKKGITLTYPISSEISPKTYEMVMEMFYRQNENRREQALELLSGADKNTNLEFTVIDDKNNVWQIFYMNNPGYVSAKKFILENRVDRAPKTGDKIAYIVYNDIFNNDYNYYNNYSNKVGVIINLGDADINKIGINNP